MLGQVGEAGCQKGAVFGEHGDVAADLRIVVETGELDAETGQQRAELVE